MRPLRLQDARQWLIKLLPSCLSHQLRNSWKQVRYESSRGSGPLPVRLPYNPGPESTYSPPRCQGSDNLGWEYYTARAFTVQPVSCSQCRDRNDRREYTKLGLYPAQVSSLHEQHQDPYLGCLTLASSAKSIASLSRESGTMSWIHPSIFNKLDFFILEAHWSSKSGITATTLKS